MEVIEGIRYDNESVVLTSTEDIKKVVELLESNTNFILETNTKKEGKIEKVSALIIATEIYSKIKNGEIVLSAIRKEKEE